MEVSDDKISFRKAKYVQILYNGGDCQSTRGCKKQDPRWRIDRFNDADYIDDLQGNIFILNSVI